MANNQFDPVTSALMSLVTLGALDGQNRLPAGSTPPILPGQGPGQGQGQPQENPNIPDPNVIGPMSNRNPWATGSFLGPSPAPQAFPRATNVPYIFMGQEPLVGPQRISAGGDLLVNLLDLLDQVRRRRKAQSKVDEAKRASDLQEQADLAAIPPPKTEDDILREVIRGVR